MDIMYTVAKQRSNAQRNVHLCVVEGGSEEGRELDVLVVKLCDVVFGNYWYWLRRRLAGEAAAEGIGLAPAPGCLHIWKLTTLVQSTVKC